MFPCNERKLDLNHDPITFNPWTEDNRDLQEKCLLRPYLRVFSSAVCFHVLVSNGSLVATLPRAAGLGLFHHSLPLQPLMLPVLVLPLLADVALL